METIHRRFLMSKRKRGYSGIGGQAVMEGVMMKNKEEYAVAVRKSNGEIVVDIGEYDGIAQGSFLTKIPFIRGIFSFIDSLILGMRTLTYSASFYEDEDAKETVSDRVFSRIFGDNAEKVIMAITVSLSLVVALALFMVFPFYLASLLDKYIQNASLLAIIEGVIRLALFLLYIVLISLMKDIRRVYQYHGAEHKCINCVERGKKLTVSNVQRSSRLHRRCGTSFLLFVMVISIILFFFIRTDSLFLRVGLRIVLVPVIAGISYELLRLSGKRDNLFVRIVSVPGLWLQRLTTREPDKEMIEVAIASVEAVFDWKKYLVDEFGIDENDL